MHFYVLISVSYYSVKPARIETAITTFTAWSKLISLHYTQIQMPYG